MASPIISFDVEDEGPNDQPGDVPNPPSPVTPNNDYRRERLNEVVQSGGRGCYLGVMMVGAFVVALASIARDVWLASAG